MCITITKTKHGTSIQATGASAQAFFDRLTRPAVSPAYKAATLSAFNDLTAAHRRQRLNNTATVRTAAQAAL
jgi:hypothetical protein